VAHTFLKPTVINRSALKLLEREIVLPRLVWNYASAEFRGAYNDVVNLRLPAILESNEYAWRNNRASEIDVDDLTETLVPVTLDHDIYSAVAVTDEELTLDIVDFNEQVLMPQVKAVARGVEDLIASTMDGGTYASTLDLASGATAGDADSAWNVLVAARKALNNAEVPRDSRVLLVGSDIEAELLLDERFIRVDSIGDGATTALREATINRLGGFTIVGSNAIDPSVGYAFHPTAFAFANVAPMVPDGVVKGSRDSYAGLALRWIRDYEARKLRDRSVVSTFAGCTSVEDDGSTNVRAVKIQLDAGS
jgi:hypothetical protein